ncbi:MAG: hypothetical protein MUE97_04555 [Phycisphaerales bacterium]|nr:hypothetical protein [Phycisphaerales bacterium]
MSGAGDDEAAGPAQPRSEQPPACEQRCPMCGDGPVRIVHVHGHGQCARCGANIEPCCQPDAWPDDAET